MDASRPAPDGGFVTRLLLFLGCSVLAGLLVAGLTLPLVGGLGLAARDTAEGFDSLPAELEIPPLPERSRILAADGSLIATFYQENRVSVPLSEVAPVMRQAVIAIEDSRFYDHGGIDVRGTMRAFINNQSGDDVQGGSTLTQQYVKQVLLAKAETMTDETKRAAAIREATEQSYSRKLRELRYAVALEEKYTKEEILERYLNIAYFGGGAYGVEAAAKRYFRTTARNLTVVQAATLAGIIQQPTAYNPTLNPERSLSRRNVVLARMGEVGVLTPAEVAEATGQPLGLKEQKRRGNGCEESRVAFFCDFVLKTILNDETFGAELSDRRRLLLQGGLTITTTLDRDAQRAAQDALADYVDPRDKVASALVSVQPGTGEIRAMAVSRGYGDGKGEIKFNPATDRAYGGSSGFQPGSTFKPFVAAAALDQGYPFSYSIYAPYQVEIGDVAGCSGEILTDEWEPVNYSTSTSGTHSLQTGIENSVNTYFAQLEEQVGICRPWEIATALGITRADGDPLQRIKSFTLGVDEVSPLAMAEAYASFAARGVHCTSIGILEVTDPNGARINVPRADCQQAIDQDVADGMNELLQGVMTRGTGAGVQIGRPAAGKTGTTNDTIAVWFVGYTPELATAVWAGNPSPPRGGFPLQDLVIGGTYYGDVCGGCLPGPIWQQMMSETLADVPYSTFSDAADDVVQGDSISVPSVSGMSVEDAKLTLREAQLEPVESGDQVYASYAEPGTIAYSYPGTGAAVYPGQRVVLYVSAGAPPEEPAPEGETEGEADGEGEITLGPGPEGEPAVPPSQR